MSATEKENLKAEAIRQENIGNYSAADRLYAKIEKG
jgi:hypothetical protein